MRHRDAQGLEGLARRCDSSPDCFYVEIAQRRRAVPFPRCGGGVVIAGAHCSEQLRLNQSVAVSLHFPAPQTAHGACLSAYTASLQTCCCRGLRRRGQTPKGRSSGTAPAEVDRGKSSQAGCEVEGKNACRQLCKSLPVSCPERHRATPAEQLGERSTILATRKSELGTRRSLCIVLRLKFRAPCVRVLR